MSTRTPLPNINDLPRRWIVVDAQGKVLGRLATTIARHLTGKTKPQYTPFLDTGDFVVVVNAQKMRIAANRLVDKKYYHHSGYPGGIKSINLRDQLAKYPERVIRSAVWGMLPHNKLGRQLIKKVKVYGGSEHPHAAKHPMPVA